MIITRLDRRGGKVTVKVIDDQHQPVTVTSLNLAVLPFETGPDANTSWNPYTYSSGVTVIIAGPDADSTNAVVVPDGGGVLWGQVSISGNPLAFPIEEMRLP